MRNRHGIKTAQITPPADDVYELVEHRPRGFAVIVNIAKGRPGSEKDVSMMSELFSQLQYEVITYENVTKEVCIVRASSLLSNNLFTASNAHCAVRI